MDVVEPRVGERGVTIAIEAERALLCGLGDDVTESMATKESGQQDVASYYKILDHQGPLKAHDPRYKGSSYNVLVSWDDGSQTWEPINLIGKQDPVTIA